jgi:hypothetical protein
LFGVSFIGNGIDATDPANPVPFAYEYLKVNEKISGAYVFKDATVNMIPEVNT